VVSEPADDTAMLSITLPYYLSYSERGGEAKFLFIAVSKMRSHNVSGEGDPP
jgi:hypothetical protein